MSSSTQSIHHGSNLTNSTHSSTSTSSSAEFYHLDEFDERPILVFDHKKAYDTRRKCVYTSSQKDLCAVLDQDEHLRVTRKEMPPDCPEVVIKRKDLFLDDERQLYQDKPTYINYVASVYVPAKIFWPRLLASNRQLARFGRLLGADYDSYADLYILSHESRPRTPGSSLDGSSVSSVDSWDAGNSCHPTRPSRSL